MIQEPKFCLSPALVGSWIQSGTARTEINTHRGCQHPQASALIDSQQCWPFSTLTLLRMFRPELHLLEALSFQRSGSPGSPKQVEDLTASPTPEVLCRNTDIPWEDITLEGGLHDPFHSSPFSQAPIPFTAQHPVDRMGNGFLLVK